jgi:hypothetical protein
MAELVTLLDDAEDASGLALAETGDVISDLRVNGEQLVQPAPGVRAASMMMINRGNITNRLTLAITHEPAASAAAAKQAAATLIAAIRSKLPAVTLLDLEFNSILFRLSDAALLSYDIHARGTTVFASYQFSGGAFAEVEEEP